MRLSTFKIAFFLVEKWLKKFGIFCHLLDFLEKIFLFKFLYKNGSTEDRYT